MKRENREFLIAAYAEGSLAADRVAEVEALLRDDSEARAMLASYRAVDSALAGIVSQQPMPELRWDRLEMALSRQVAGLAARPTSTVTETEEENLSRLAAGELPDSERALVDAKLSRDPHARLVLAEYTAIELGLEQIRSSPLPAVKWDTLAAHLSNAVRDAADSAAPETIKLPTRRAVVASDDGEERVGVIGRIGTWLSQPRWIAAAACLLIGTTIAVRVAGIGGSTGTDNTAVNSDATPKPSVPVIAVSPGPKASPTGKPVLEIEVAHTPGKSPNGGTAADVRIGPPSDVAALEAALNDPSIIRPSRSLVVSDKATVQDGGKKKDSTAVFGP